MAKILAWESQKDRKNVLAKHGPGAKEYFKHPVKEEHWIKTGEHHYDGLNYYKTREKFTYNDLLELLDVETVNWLKENTECVAEAVDLIAEGAEENIEEIKWQEGYYDEE